MVSVRIKRVCVLVPPQLSAGQSSAFGFSKDARCLTKTHFEGLDATLPKVQAKEWFLCSLLESLKMQRNLVNLNEEKKEAGVEEEERRS